MPSMRAQEEEKQMSRTIVKVGNEGAVGHGHVVPNADGSVARCGGPAICPTCAREQLEVTTRLAEADSLEPAKQAAKIAALIIIESALNILQADPHQWSDRGCNTCRSITALTGKTFGCYRYMEERAAQRAREGIK